MTNGCLWLLTLHGCYVLPIIYEARDIVYEAGKAALLALPDGHY